MVKEAAQTAVLSEDARSLFDSPIIYVIGYLLMVYFLIYFIAIFIAPALFGSRPYYGPYKREIILAPAINAPGGPTPEFISTVTNAIHNKPWQQ